MEKREVKFSLVFRDMWQSAGKYVPIGLELASNATGMPLKPMDRMAFSNTYWPVPAR